MIKTTINPTQILLLSAILLASCSTDMTETQPAGSQAKGIEFAAADGTDSRTAIGGDGKTVVWKAGDAVGIFSPQIDAANNYRAEIDAEADGQNNASLQTTLQYNGNVEHTFYAYYPYSEGQSSTTISGTLPVVQDGDFGKNALMYATQTVTPTAETTSPVSAVPLLFKHPFAYLNISLNAQAGSQYIDAQVVEITVSAAAGNALTGDYTIDLTATAPEPEFAATSNKVKMTSGITLSETAQDNVLVVKAGELTGTTSVYITLSKDGEFLYMKEDLTGGKTLTAQKKISIRRTVDDNMLVDAVPITFADPAVETICLAWDMDQDGYFTTAEAAAVTSLGSAFQGTAITSFNELQYFTKLTSIGYQAFYQCSDLKEITLPESVNTIGDNAFRGCSSLTNVTLPEGLSSIGSYTFAACHLLSEIVIPQNITSIGAYAFTSSGLTNIHFPDAVSGLTIDHHAFFNCDKLPEITLPDGLTTLSRSILSNCEILRRVTIPGSVSNIETEAFRYSDQIQEIYCYAIEPPTVGTNAFGDVYGDLYVPAESSSKYDANTDYDHFKVLSIPIN